MSTNITPEKLGSIAKSAVESFLSGTSDNLTDAVVKVASSEGALTGEHVRRICEMTYHDAFERIYRDAKSDNYVSFDPPDAVKAASSLRATKVASFRKEAGMDSTGTETMDKVASSAMSPLRRHNKVNAFSSMMDKAASEDQSKINWHDPLGDVRRVRHSVKEAIIEVGIKCAAALGSENLSIIDLCGLAKQASREGASTSQIMYIGATMAKDLPNHIRSPFLSDVAELLFDSGHTDDQDKVASFQEVNENHPLSKMFNKVATLRSERVHLEVALDELKRNLEAVDGQIKTILR